MRKARWAVALMAGWWLGGAAAQDLAPGMAASAPASAVPAELAQVQPVPAAQAASGAALSLAAAMMPPTVLQATLSPDGRHVAAIINRGLRTRVMVVNTADQSTRELMSAQWERDGHFRLLRLPRRLTWVTSSILAVDHGIVAEAIDLQGKRIMDLGGAVVGKAVPADPESPLVLAFADEDRDRFAMVNVHTREKTVIRVPMSGKPVSWAFDGRGRLRALTLASTGLWTRSTTLTQWYRGTASDDWLKLDEYPVTDDGWTPLAAVDDADELLISSRQGRDTAAIFSYDPVKRQRGELLAAHPRDDIVALEDPRAGSHPSVVTVGLKPVRHWFDGRWAGLQKAVDQALPDRINVLSGQPRGLVLVFSYADVEPGRWYLLNTQGMQLRPLFVARPDVDPARMRPMQTLRYASDDGLEVPAYLTVPAGPGPHPLVVLVHGGPVARDHWRWDANVQLLAAHGFAVLQPQFRGSSGFGRAFERAGDGQWGLRMQDDVTAGVRHLVERGVADARRVCIYGASYGGYVAVWGLVKTPDLYRCGITVAGVSDIGHLFSDWNDLDRFGRAFWRERIGDPERDKARFDAVSPLLNVTRIQAPLLIAHGERDERVPIGHAERLKKALDQHGKPYQWLSLGQVGHSGWPFFIDAMLAKEVLAYLQRHIGPQAGVADVKR